MGEVQAAFLHQLRSYFLGVDLIEAVALVINDFVREVNEPLFLIFFTVEHWRLRSHPQCPFWHGTQRVFVGPSDSILRGYAQARDMHPPTEKILNLSFHLTIGVSVLSLAALKDSLSRSAVIYYMRGIIVWYSLFIEMKCVAYQTILTLFFFLIVHIPDSNATSIIVGRTPTEVIIAADSFLADSTGGDKGTACKIRQAGNAFFAISGLLDAQLGRENIDFFKIATDIFQRNIPIEERLSIYDAIVKWNLIRVVDANRQDEALSNFAFSKGKPTMTLTLAMPGKDFPIVFTIEHFVKSSSEEPARVESDIKEFKYRLNSGAEMIYDSEDQLICWPLVRDSDIRFLDRTIGKCIERIAERDPMVKLPADILKITQTDAKWIQHKPECTEIDQSLFNH